MFKLQLGFVLPSLTLIGATVGVAAFGGLWTFYHVKVGALQTEITAKQVAIDTMAQEKAACLAQVTGLQTANTSFNQQVQEQNAALVEVQKERNAKASEALVAQRAAAQQSVTFKKRSATILAQSAGTDWSGTWSKMVTDYTLARQAEPK